MTAGTRQAGWHGWPATGGGESEWTDLTYRISVEVPRLAKFAAPSIEKISSIAEHACSVTRLDIVCHTGTHVDAPCHFIPGAPGVDEIPLQRLHGPAVVVRVDVGAGGEVGVDDLARSGPAAGDIVILDTGWWRGGGGDGDHPCLSEDAARWLVERGVKLLATDLPTPDLAISRRVDDFDWPVHRILLGRGVLIAENLTNLGGLAPRVDAMLMPLPIAGSDGSPVRALARSANRG
jgi:kynurenine formamidase